MQRVSGRARALVVSCSVSNH